MTDDFLNSSADVVQGSQYESNNEDVHWTITLAGILFVEIKWRMMDATMDVDSKFYLSKDPGQRV